MNTPQERFALTPRRFDPDEDWFGVEANPSRTINVPLIDPYLVEPDPAAPWYDTGQDTSETDATTPNHIPRKVHIMAGETTITVIGNLTNDPELRFTRPADPPSRTSPSRQRREPSTGSPMSGRTARPCSSAPRSGVKRPKTSPNPSPRACVSSSPDG